MSFPQKGQRRNNANTNSKTRSIGKRGLRIIQTRLIQAKIKQGFVTVRITNNYIELIHLTNVQLQITVMFTMRENTA